MNVGAKADMRFPKSKRLFVSGTNARDLDIEGEKKNKGIPNTTEPASNKEETAALPEGASENKANSSGGDKHLFSIGDRVEAKFRGRGSRFYPGIIKSVSVAENKYDIDYDDGDRDRNLSAEHVRKLGDSVEQQHQRERRSKNSIGRKSVDGMNANAHKESAVLVDEKALLFRKGDLVEARFRGRGRRWYKGVIKECFESQNEYTIHYDDGDIDKRLAAEFVRAIDDSKVSHENTTTALRDFNSVDPVKAEVALSSDKEDKHPSKEQVVPDKSAVEAATIVQSEKSPVAVDLAEIGSNEDDVVEEELELLSKP